MKDWQAWRDSNPQPSDLESDALAVEPQACLLSRFLMDSMLPAESTVPFLLDPFRLQTTILGRRIRTPVADTAGQIGQISGHNRSTLVEPTTGLEPVTSSLPRTRSTG